MGNEGVKAGAGKLIYASLTVYNRDWSAGAVRVIPAHWLNTS